MQKAGHHPGISSFPSYHLFLVLYWYVEQIAQSVECLPSNSWLVLWIYQSCRLSLFSGASQINYFQCRKLDITLASALSPVTTCTLYCTGMSNRSLKVLNVSLPIHGLYCEYTSPAGCRYWSISNKLFSIQKAGHHPGISSFPSYHLYPVLYWYVEQIAQSVECLPSNSWLVLWIYQSCRLSLLEHLK